MKFLTSLIAGVGSYILFSTLITGHFILAFLIGILGFSLFWKVFSMIFNKKEKSEQNTGSNSAPKDERVEKIAEEGISKIMKMSNQARMIRNNEVSNKIKDICRIGLEIFEDLKKSPGDLNRAKPFVNYYLDSTVKIVNQYVEFSARKDNNPDVQETLARVEGNLDKIKETFEKQLKVMLEDDIMDLDVELSVLEKTMKMEG